MKKIKWRFLFITCVVCLLPILFGVAMWDSLPDKIAIHFDINNNPDNFGSKGFAVFGLPVMMVALQIICCVINDLNSAKHGERKKLEYATKWIIPAMSIVLQIITLGYSLGWDLDIRKYSIIIVGIIFIIIGNYLPKFDYVKNYNVDTEKARKINRFIGFENVILGILFLISAFLPPVTSVICLLLLIPYTIISIIYGIVVSKK